MPSRCRCVIAGVGAGESDPKELEVLPSIAGFWLSLLTWLRSPRALNRCPGERVVGDSFGGSSGGFSRPRSWTLCARSNAERGFTRGSSSPSWCEVTDGRGTALCQPHVHPPTSWRKASDGQQKGTSPVSCFLYPCFGLMRRTARSPLHQEVDSAWTRVNLCR